jgi:hypothetical protein
MLFFEFERDLFASLLQRSRALAKPEVKSRGFCGFARTIHNKA